MATETAKASAELQTKASTYQRFGAGRSLNPSGRGRCATSLFITFFGE